MSTTRREWMALSAAGVMAPSVISASREGAAFQFGEWSVSQMRAAMDQGRITATELTQAYLHRIAALDRRGPRLRAVIAVNPDALRVAAERDASQTVLGPLHGVPVLVKDNIETRELPTTAGSLALKNNHTGQDAFLIQRLRAAGAVILGKTNLSEWANIRSPRSSSGWSAVGGQCRNPYALDRSPCGSSSGSAVAVAANLCAVAVGTETDGSVICPAATNGIVGIKPTLGWVSRAGIVPLAARQDTAGAMGRSVADAALLLRAMSGVDPADPPTLSQRGQTPLPSSLSVPPLRGCRFGLARALFGFDPPAHEVLFEAIARLRAAGAIIVEIPEWPVSKSFTSLEVRLMLADFKRELAEYLADKGLPYRSLSDIIRFNQGEARELAHFGQELFEAAEALPGRDSASYKLAERRLAQLISRASVAQLMERHRVDAVLGPSNGRAWTIDLERGDAYLGGSSGVPAVTGCPHVTVPAGMSGGLPVGLSLMGAAFSDARLIALAAAVERRLDARRPPQLRAKAGP